MVGDGVFHYAPDRHAIERRCALGADFLPPDTLLIALTSIHWREAWKYGERAFRYCQHDLGHAIAAVDVAASLVGWRAELLPDWSHDDIARLTGIDRDEDFVEAEREEPACLLAVSREPARVDRAALVGAAQRGMWTGRASQLSEDHVQWTFIDEIAEVTRGSSVPSRRARPARPESPARPAHPASLLIQRRSALAFDGRSRLERDRFFEMLRRVMPDGSPVFDALWWRPCVHLALFVHRVEDVEPGLYLLAREDASGARLRAALKADFLHERIDAALPLSLLVRGDARPAAATVSCHQDIAADGFFSLGMIAEFESSLEEYGAPFYRQLFWECGVIGQILYLEAEAAGARATGIGCFFDDPVHDLLGLSGHAFQSLYHFTVGMPVADVRLTSAPGYDWEIT